MIVRASPCVASQLPLPRTYHPIDKFNRFIFERNGDIEVLATQPIFIDAKLSRETPAIDKIKLLDQYVASYQIYDSIAKHNPVAAQRVEDAIRANCIGLADFPFASAATDEAHVRRLQLVRYPYTIFFRINVARQRVEIARVLHGARIKNLGTLPDDDR